MAMLKYMAMRMHYGNARIYNNTQVYDNWR